MFVAVVAVLLQMALRCVGAHLRAFLECFFVFLRSTAHGKRNHGTKQGRINPPVRLPESLVNPRWHRTVSQDVSMDMYGS